MLSPSGAFVQTGEKVDGCSETSWTLSTANQGGCRTALVDGALGVAVVLGGQLRVALRLTFAGDRISGVEASADVEHIGSMDTEMLEP